MTIKIKKPLIIMKNGYILVKNRFNTKKILLPKKTKRKIKVNLNLIKIKQIHRNMIQRCYYTKDKSFKYYGGRGIIVSDEWKDFNNFQYDLGRFWKKGLSIERIDVNGNYCKENCKWIPIGEQNKNRRKPIR